MKNLFTCFFALLTFFGNAQIIYTDITPDATTTVDFPGSLNSLVAIDFNGDGTEEYNFRWDGGAFETVWWIHTTFNGSNELFLKGIDTDPNGSRYIQPISLNTSINSSSNWGNSTPDPLIGDGIMDPNFRNLGDKYIGCKFQLDANTHYGWIRVNLDANLNFVVKDYAYESTPNNAINAGDEGFTASVQDIGFNKFFNSYPNPVSKNFILKVKQQINVSSFKIYDAIGQAFIPDFQSLDSKFILNLEDFNSGIYFLQVQTENNNVLTKKIIV